MKSFPPRIRFLPIPLLALVVWIPRGVCSEEAAAVPDLLERVGLEQISAPEVAGCGGRF